MTMIGKARLGTLTELDSGAFGVVYRVRGCTVEGFTDLAYKEFTTALTHDGLANLEELVRIRTRLDTRSRQLLDEAAAWPLCLVADGGAVSGFVMRLIPNEFFVEQVLPDGRCEAVPAKAQWIVADPQKAADASIHVPAMDDIPARLVLAAKLAHVLGVLHRAGIVYGDLSLNNVIYSAGTPPKVMLVDCDGAQATGTPSIVQPHTDDWQPPEVAAQGLRQDLMTDRYKLALFILRVLKPGAHSSQATDPDRVATVLDARGHALMVAGLSDDRSRRPSARDWFRYLSSYITDLTSPPEITSVAIDRVAIMAGHIVRVAWRCRGARRITIEDADGLRVEADASTGAGVFSIPVTRTGPFILAAENSFGATRAMSEPAYVLQPPTISRITIPPVAIPEFGSGTAELAGFLVRQYELSASAPVFSGPDVSPFYFSMVAPPLSRALIRPGGPSARDFRSSALADSVTPLIRELDVSARQIVAQARNASS